MMQGVIETDRLTLRPLDLADRTAIVSGLNDFEVNYWTMQTSWPYMRADADIWFDEQMDNDLHRVIDLDGEFIGEMGLHSPQDGVYNIGYWLGQEHWGYGYMTEALAAFIDYLAKTHNITEIGLNYHKDNERSARVAAKLGFVVTGSRFVKSAGHGIHYLEVKTRRSAS